MSKLKTDLKQESEKIKQKIRAVSPTRLVIVGLMIVITACSYIFYDYFFGNKNGWCTEPSTGTVLFDDCLKLIPILVRCVQSVTILLTISTILVLVIRKIFRKSQRSITVSSLICNLINWLTAIIFVIIVLSVFGVNTTAIITGAGVLTLVVGLGMQSLIADIVAGLFIVFENEFNVGDYVTIDDFRGKVISIGIRTTQIMDATNNVKIFNNNSIQGVVNHDMELSVAKTYIDIEYGAKIPQVEKIIKENIGNITIPDAVGEAVYQGVSALGASGVTLLFTVTCHEQDIYSVNRALNGAIKNMFDENGINVPFPQVVVHNGDK